MRDDLVIRGLTTVIVLHSLVPHRAVHDTYTLTSGVPNLSPEEFAAHALDAIEICTRINTKFMVLVDPRTPSSLGQIIALSALSTLSSS